MATEVPVDTSVASKCRTPDVHQVHSEIVGAINSRVAKKEFENKACSEDRIPTVTFTDANPQARRSTNDALNPVHEQRALSPRLVPFALELQKALQDQDLAKVLENREKLHKFVENEKPQGQEKADAKQLWKLVDGAWEKLKALKLIQANAELDSNTFGAIGSDTKEAFEERCRYRQEAMKLVSKLSLEQCAGGALLEKCSADIKGDRAMRIWESNLETDLLFHVGKAGWVSIDQTKVDSGILSIVPHQCSDGLAHTGADILENNRDGERTFDARFLEARLHEATELVPGVYLRHVAFSAGRDDLRGPAFLAMQGMILPENWNKVQDQNVRDRFSELQKQEAEKLKKDLESLQARNLKPEQLAAELIKVQVEWSKSFAHKTYAFVRDERVAGRLQLNTNGEKAFRELNGMYEGDDAKRARINHWLDVIAIDGTMMVMSGGMANIARAGAEVALERYIARSVGEEVLKRTSVRAGVYISGKAVEGVVFHGSEAFLRRLGGNKNAFDDFWLESVKSSVSFMGMHGSSKLAVNAVLALAERTLPNETRTVINTLLKGEQKNLFLAKVIDSNAKLKLLNKAGQLSAETLYMTLQSQADAVIAGKPLSSLLTPQEWADALGNSALQVAAIKTGRRLTGGVEQSFANAQKQIEAAPNLSATNMIPGGTEVKASGSNSEVSNSKPAEQPSQVAPKPAQDAGPAHQAHPDTNSSDKAEARRTLLRAFQGFSNPDKIIQSDALTPQDIHDVAATALIENLTRGSIDLAKRILDRGLLSESELSSEAIRKAARLGLISILSHGEVRSVPQLLGLKMLHPDDVPEAARTALVNCLTGGSITYAGMIVDLKLISEQDLKQKDIRDAARKGLEDCLSKGLIESADNILYRKLVNEDVLTSQSVRDAARAGLIISLGKHNGLSEAENLLALNLLSEKDLRGDDLVAAVQASLKQYVQNGWTRGLQLVSDLKLLTPEQLRQEARSAFALYLSDNRPDQAQAVLNLGMLKSDDLQSQEVRDGARRGLADELSLGRLDEARKIINFQVLTKSDIALAAEEGLAKGLSGGWTSGWLDFANQLASSDVIQQEAIKRAAETGLRNNLAAGRTEAMRHIMDFGLLSPDVLKTTEMRQAAQAGLTVSLKAGNLQASKQIMRLEILTKADLQSKDVSEAGSACLAKLLERDRGSARALLKLNILDQASIDRGLKQAVEQGSITNAISIALGNGITLDTALQRYLGIDKLTNDTAAKVFQDLKARDPWWQDEQNVQKPFEDGAAIFGASRMLSYVLRENIRPHDALLAFNDVIKLYQRSGLTADQFYGNILSQVNRDSAINDFGSSYSRLAAIARDFPDDPQSVLKRARSFSDVGRLQELAGSFSDDQSIFSSWPKLQRFANLQQFINRAELLPDLKALRQDNKGKLADWIESLAFHPDSRVSMEAILQFWKNPDTFIDMGEVHAPQSHDLKKPSHYTNIPHLDLDAEQLRDALVNGTLDRLQVFAPMKIEYEVGGQSTKLADELSRALGSRSEGRKGEARNAGKLFSEVSKLLKANNVTLAQVMSGGDVQQALEQDLKALLYNSQFGVERPRGGMRLVAEIHRKSDPLAVVAGDDTASCMGFGTGKNNVYMFNTNDALFTVRLVREDGTSRTIAQSVLTKDKDVKSLFPTILKKLQENPTEGLHTIIPETALRGEKSVISADNVEVHPNYRSGEYPEALQAIYRDFFAEYIKRHGNNENLRADKMVIGVGYSDTFGSLPREPNTFVPQAPVGYTDKSHEDVLSLALTEQKGIPIRVLRVEDNQVPNRINPHTGITSGVSPLTFEDTLSLAYLEGKVFQDNPSLREGLHNMENALIAKDINNAAKGRPNLSLKYEDGQGRMKGYMLAYEGEMQYDGKNQSVVYISDFTSDRSAGISGRAQPGVTGGKLLLEFGNLYKQHYLDKGKLTPIFANARDATSYALLMKQMQALGERYGYRFEVKELNDYMAGSDKMHNVLIIPHSK